ncbi:hypothetical protein H4582DRAFT_1089430 [Lactarius indigo]|nr:hypothetical protein H4582DRAFT_1089430 [Lactarius indigo]
MKPSRLAPSSSSLAGTNIDKGKRESQNPRGRAVQSTMDRNSPSPSLDGEQAARRGPRGGDNDSSDQLDLPLAQKLGKIAPADTRSKPGKKTGTKDARAPAARGKRTTSKTKRIAVAADDADVDGLTKRTAKSTVARTQTGGATTINATAGRGALENARKRGAEEGRRGREEAASPVAPPRGVEDVADVNLPPTKRARVLQEKSAPRKRKERAKNVDDGNDAMRAANNENENGPPTKKRRRADPKTATAVSRRRPGKENENGTEQSKPARKASKGALDKLSLSPTGAHRKQTVKGKPPLRPGGTRVRSRGLPPDVLRRIKVNAQTLEAPQEIDDDDPIDFLRS